MKFTIYQDSRQGGRANNEDRTTYCYSRDALLMVVADGMGGHHYGEIAAQIAVQTFADAFQEAAQPRLADPFGFLQQNMNRAHLAILDYVERHQMSESPRTTCVACLVQDSIAYWAHVGDSRLYLMRNGRVMVQTKDHSRIRLLVEEESGIPLVGRVAAGEPLLAQQHIEGHYQVDPGMFKPSADFLLRVSGMSMKDIGILDGDLLAVHKTQDVRNGQVVVARIDDEVTVKRLKKQGNTVQLLPENNEFSPIVVDLREQSFSIEGLAVGVIRNGEWL